jgi:acetylornithine deacetylase/succinyl-diaminopimelate desuccinylase-like protein
VVNILCDLVARPSVNPMGRSVATEAPYFEGRVSDYLEAFFRSLDVPFERRTISPGRDNLIARFEPPGARQTLLWDAHQDTVPAEGMVIEPFQPTLEGGRIYGRGSCDVKGGMAAMLSAFARLVKEQPKGAARVLLACTVDEEYTHTGSSALASQGLDVDLAIVAEPTMLEVVTAHKGAVRWKVLTGGVACHSSRPRDGVNAIYRMAHVLTALQTYAERLQDSGRRPSRSAASKGAKASTSFRILAPSTSIDASSQGKTSTASVRHSVKHFRTNSAIPFPSPSASPGSACLPSDPIAHRLGLSRSETPSAPSWASVHRFRPSRTAPTPDRFRPRESRHW